MRDLHTRRRYLCCHGSVLDRGVAARLGRRLRKFSIEGVRKSHVCLRQSTSSRATTGDGSSGTALSSNLPLLEKVDRKIEIQRSLAGSGATLSPDAEASHQPQARVVNCRTD